MTFSRAGRWAGYATAICAFLHAAVSFYWGLGGMWLLDLVGQEAVERAEAGDVGGYVAVWTAGVAKAGAGIAALALVQPWGRRIFPRKLLLIGGWGGAVVLILYGGVQIIVQLLVRTEIITPADDIDWRGFDGHLYLWAPWFFMWGVLMAITAYYYTRDTRPQ